MLVLHVESSMRAQRVCSSGPARLARLSVFLPLCMSKNALAAARLSLVYTSHACASAGSAWRASAAY